MANALLVREFQSPVNLFPVVCGMILRQLKIWFWKITDLVEDKISNIIIVIFLIIFLDRTTGIQTLLLETRLI